MTEMPLVGQKILTEADLLQLSAGDVRFEVIDGEIVEMTPVGVQHADIAGNVVYNTLKQFARHNHLGKVPHEA